MKYNLNENQIERLFELFENNLHLLSNNSKIEYYQILNQNSNLDEILDRNLIPYKHDYRQKNYGWNYNGKYRDIIENIKDDDYINKHDLNQIEELCNPNIEELENFWNLKHSNHAFLCPRSFIEFYKHKNI